MPIDRN